MTLPPQPSDPSNPSCYPFNPCSQERGSLHASHCVLCLTHHIPNRDRPRCALPRARPILSPLVPLRQRQKRQRMSPRIVVSANWPTACRSPAAGVDAWRRLCSQVC